MPKIIELTEEQAATLEAYCKSIDLHTTCIWPIVEQGMRDQGIENPERDLEQAREVLRGS